MLSLLELLNPINQDLRFMIQQTQHNLPLLLDIVALLCGVFLLNFLCQQRLLILGIIPRHLLSLPGILFAPLLHADFNHLFFNLIPLIVFSDFLLLQGLTYFLTVTLLITLISGLFIWCFARPGLYVGASAVLTGFWALLISHIYTEGTFTAIILGIVSLYYFFGIFYGLFPSKQGVSWQGHLYGLIAGLLVSYFIG